MLQTCSRRIVGALLALLLAGVPVVLWGAAPGSRSGVTLTVSDDFLEPAPGHVDAPVHFTTTRLLQDQPALAPRTFLNPRTQTPAETNSFVSDFYSTYQVSKSVKQNSRRLADNSQADLVLGVESKVRASRDAGSLLGKSPSTTGVGVQRRTPIYTDPRIRGSRIGSLAASGSHWVPARIDLDTMLSKVDSSQIASIGVIKGPFSSLYGPGFSFMDVEFVGAPRFDQPTNGSGSTRLEYLSNGQQWHGRQALVGGDEDWGYRFGYSDRSGSDYLAGDGTRMPSSYQSRAFDFTIGRDITDERSIEFTYLRLDQTDVEFPGMAFDIDYLVTDGYEVTYRVGDSGWADYWESDLWYNRTRFEGNAQNPAKRQQFPLLDAFNYVGFTDVDAMSSGFRTAATWEECDWHRFTAGMDLRYVRQELNEIASGRIGFMTFTDNNSPIPQSDQVNPGFFVEDVREVSEALTIRAGGRVDIVRSDVVDDPTKLASLGLQDPQMTLGEILGTEEWLQRETLWMGYLTGQYALTETERLDVSFGYGQQAPSLTEMYAAESFLFLLQNGQNVAIGDPRLAPEKRFQLDVGLGWDRPNWRGKVNGFYTWAHDYITFENVESFVGPPIGAVEQVSLKYVNTDLATLTGVEVYAEYDLRPEWTLFGNLSYVRGDDRTRNGNFATQPGAPGAPSQQVAGLDRGFFGGVSGEESEPLPSILPLDTMVGVRWHSAEEIPRWGLEFYARIVDAQTRVAASLLESATPGFTTFNANGFWRYSDDLTFSFGAHNFTNTHYREHLDFRSPSGSSVFQPGAAFFFASELTY